MKAREFDHKVKLHIEKADQQKPTRSNWDKKQSWSRIKQMLESKSGKMIIWYFSMAASISLVMANAIHVPNSWIPEHDQSEFHMLKSKKTNLQRTSIPLIQIAANVSQSTRLPLTGPECETKDDLFTKTLLVRNAQNNVHNQVSPGKKKPGSIQMELGTTISGPQLSVSPEIYWVKKFPQHHRLRSAGFSVETRLALSPGHHDLEDRRSRSQFEGTVFLNAVIRGGGEALPWQAKIGYSPMHFARQKDDFTPGLKLNYQLKFSNHFSIGPEVQFSRDFKKAVPGITLSFG